MLPCMPAHPRGIVLGTQVLPVTELGSHLSHGGNYLICHITVIVSVLQDGSNQNADGQDQVVRLEKAISE